MKMFGMYVGTALKQLFTNKGRSVLTMLGIIIGIGSVIFILTTGQIAKNFLLGQISQFGTNVIEVAPAGDFGPFGSDDRAQLTDADVRAVEESTLLSEITDLSAGDYTVSKQLQYGSESTAVSVYADRPGIFSVNNYTVEAGRFYDNADMLNSSRVLVIGKPLAEDWFGSYDAAVGKQVKLGDALFEVIGVANEGSLGPGSFGVSIVYAPLTTIRSLFIEPADQKNVSFILVEFDPNTDVETFTNRLRFVLLQNHAYFKENPDTLTVVSRSQALDIFDAILVGIQAFISAVAGISLLVGGIGIMNIMLVTVKERTKEIGLRKAIGARNRSILIQFLIEAVVLTTVGGIIGICFGLGLSYIVVLIADAVQPTWGITFVFVPNAILLSFGVAAFVGLVFGMYPALKASRLQAIEALRYE